MDSSPRPVAWVLGAKGFLGRHVARQLDSEGWRVEGLGHGQWTDHGDWGLRSWMESSVTREALEKLAASEMPGAVFCAAGSGTVGESFTDADKAHHDTVESAEVTLDFLASHAPEAVFVYPSSCGVYGNRNDASIPEDSLVRPASPYAAYKLEVERACRRARLEHGLRCGVIRFFSVYGPGLRKQLIWDMAARAQGGQTISLSGTGKETRDLLHVDDASALVSLVIARLRDESDEDPFVVNGGTGSALSVKEIARIVLENLPTEAEVTFSGRAREGDPPHFRADADKAHLLGFEPRWNPEAGIADYCGWIARELWGELK